MLAQCGGQVSARLFAGSEVTRRPDGRRHAHRSRFNDESLAEVPKSVGRPSVSSGSPTPKRPKGCSDYSFEHRIILDLCQKLPNWTALIEST